MTAEHAELTSLMATVKDLAQGNKEYLDAMAGVLGILTGVLIKSDLTTQDSIIESIERISTTGSPRQRMMLAIVQAGVSQRLPL